MLTMRRLGFALAVAAAAMFTGHEALHAGHGHAAHAEGPDHCCLCHAAVTVTAAPVLPSAPVAIVADAAPAAPDRALDRAPFAARPRSPPAA